MRMSLTGCLITMTFYMIDERSSQISGVNCAWVQPTSFSQHLSIIFMGYNDTNCIKPEVPQSPDARLSWAFVVKGFISIISKVKMQEKIQRDWNSMTLTFALTFCMRTPTRTRTPGYSNSSSALKCRRAKYCI